MNDTSRHDAWQAGDNYEAYMGRWSRRVAPRFLDWLDAPPGLAWLEVGCGTGALSAAILAQCAPDSLLSIDPSDDFVAAARRNVADPRAAFRIGDAQSLGEANASRDVVVSGLVLNFVPDRARALAEMKRMLRPGGRIAFYVWDYAGGGVEFMHAFWRAAAALDPAAGELGEDRRFPYCTAEGLRDMTAAAGLSGIECTPIEIATTFADFDEYWRPFTLGAGPAPGYCTSLTPEVRQRLKERLRADLAPGEDGTIAMRARAWAVKAGGG